MGYKVIMNKTLNQRIYETPGDIKKAIYDSGYEAGKKAAVEEFINRLKAENAISIAGYLNYVIAEHQFEVIKKLVLEGNYETNS